MSKQSKRQTAFSGVVMLVPLLLCLVSYNIESASPRVRQEDMPALPRRESITVAYELPGSIEDAIRSARTSGSGIRRDEERLLTLNLSAQPQQITPGRSVRITCVCSATKKVTVKPRDSSAALAIGLLTGKDTLGITETKEPDATLDGNIALIYGDEVVVKSRVKLWNNGPNNFNLSLPDDAAEGDWKVEVTITGTRPPLTEMLQFQVTLQQEAGRLPETPSPRVSPSPDGKPVADFKATPLRGPAPLSVTFDNLSQGNRTRCELDLGDGTRGIPAEKGAVHVYTKPGSYTVTLTVVGPGGTSTKTERDLIGVLLGERDRIVRDIAAKGKSALEKSTLEDLNGPYMKKRSCAQALANRSGALRKGNRSAELKKQDEALLTLFLPLIGYDYTHDAAPNDKVYQDYRKSLGMILSDMKNQPAP